MKKFLLYTTIISLFTESAYINIGFDFKLFYVVIFINYIIILVNSKFSLALHKYHFLILLLLLISGAISIFIQKNSLILFLEQFLGVAFVSTYYYHFFKFFSVDNIRFVFEKYVSMATFICLIGIPIYIYDFSLISIEARFKSVLTEPAHFVAIILPALFYVGYCWNRSKFLVLFTSFLLSLSAVGYISAIFNLILTRVGNLRKSFLAFIFILPLAIIFYFYSVNFKVRIDDSSKVVLDKDLTGVNISTYSFFSNAFVALESIQLNPLIGQGFGAHILTREKFLYNVNGIEGFSEFFALNQKDGNSLFLRVSSDLGFIGLALIIFFIIHNYVPGNTKNGLISKSVLVYFCAKLLRDGHYFSPEMYFFVMIYYFNKLEYLKLKFGSKNFTKLINADVES